MPQYSKVVISCAIWKEKAKKRALENKELHRSITRKNEQIAQLRARVKTMESEAKTKSESVKKTDNAFRASC